MMIWLGALIILLFWFSIVGFGLGFSWVMMSPFYDTTDYELISNKESDEGFFWASLFQQT